jgi:hypothetical protein
MIPFQIGNWLITNNEIQWNGATTANYSIPKERLNEPCAGVRNHLYEWLLHTVTKEFVTIPDVYTFNTAFVYAQQAWGVGQGVNFSFADTFVEQIKLFNIHDLDIDSGITILNDL